MVIGRIANALESIASSLLTLVKEVQEMRTEQKQYLDLAQREVANGPRRISEVFDQLQALAGGKHGD